MNEFGQDSTFTHVEDQRNLRKQEKPIRRITSIYLHQWTIFEDTLQRYWIVMCMMYHYFTYGHVNDVILIKYPGNL